MMQFSVGSVLILISVVLFALAACGVGFSSVAIVPLALSFFAAGHIV